MQHFRFPFSRVPLSVAVVTAILALALPIASSAQVCGDVNNTGTVTAGDALAVLRAAVGQPTTLVCDGACASLEPRVDELESALTSALAAIDTLQSLLAGVSRTDDALVISGANLQVVDGSGQTAGPTNGLGNIIVGYNEGTDSQVRSGSHNLVVGVENEYTSFGGIVAGEHNEISARCASVLGGMDNAATDTHSAVLGGSANLATGQFSAVGGGFSNEASGINAAIAGGCENDATNTYATVSGGRLAIASGQWSSVSGGYSNKATALYSAVSGGSTHTANAQFNWRAGTLSEAQ